MLLTLLVLGCAHVSHDTAAGTPAAHASGAQRVALPGLLDVGCAPTSSPSAQPSCVALAAGHLYALPSGTALPAPDGLSAFDTLRATGDAWEVEGPCFSGRCAAPLTLTPPSLGPTHPAQALPPVGDPPSIADGAAAFTGAWNIGIHAGWRSAFAPVIVGPGGGKITWLRGIDGAGQLVRAGEGPRSVRIGAATASASIPAWLAMHPSGREAYLVAWPSPWVRGFDPVTLDIRWTVPVEGAAQGLFVDPAGRWLVVGVGDGATDRLADWEIPLPDAAPAADPARDEALRGLARPPMDSTVVIDLANHTVAGTATGAFRRWLSLGDRFVLATDHEVVFLNPGAPPR